MQLSLFVDPQEGMSYATISAAAARAERDGYEGIYRSDHLTSTAGAHERAATEAWSTLAGLARETTRLRLGTLVTPIGFRHPSLYAKIVSTVDEMSGGRTAISIGTGWYPPEHELLGFEFDAIGTRFAKLEEYLEVLVRLWRGDGETFDGAHYRLGAVPARPLTVRRPTPWIIIGGHGPRRTPRLAAAYADEYNVDWPSPQMCAELFANADAACKDAGRDPASLRRSVLLGAIVGTDDADVERRFATAVASLGIADGDAWRAQNAESWTVGTPDVLTARLRRYADVGVEHVMLMLAPAEDLDMISLVASEVMPALGHEAP